MAEEKKMSLIQKVIRIRKEFTGLRIEKSGNGPKYDYFQLEDFIPKATDLCELIGVLPVISFASDSATMTVYDTDSPDTLVITCPMAESKLMNCQPVQNLGASITYLRRYLWMVFLELCVPEKLDANQTAPNGYQNGYQPRNNPPAQRATVAPQNAPQKDPRPAAAPQANAFDPRAIWNECVKFYGYDPSKPPTDKDNKDAMDAAHQLFDPYAKKLEDLTPEKGAAIMQRIEAMRNVKGPEEFQDDAAELGA